MTRRISETTLRQGEIALSTVFPGINFTLAPNGAKVIWVTNSEAVGACFSISFEVLREHLFVLVNSMAGANPLAVSGTKVHEGESTEIPAFRAYELIASVGESKKV